MSSVNFLREFVNERLTAAAEEIFCVFAKTIVEYEEEINRQRKLLDIVWNPEIKLHRIEPPQEHEEEEEDLTDQQLCIQERISSLDQEDLEPPQVKEEQEELGAIQEEELLVVKLETPSYEQSDHSEDQMIYFNPDDSLSAAETKSAVNIPIINSMLCDETSYHQLLSADQEEPNQQKRLQKNESHIKNVSNPKLSEDNCNTSQGEKSFKCAKGGKDFKHKSQLQSHLRIHTGEMTFVCKTCGKRFADSSACKKHVRSHTCEKPLTCRFCWVVFRKASNLKVHMRTHTGEKPYVCTTCGKRFAHSSVCKRHLTTHTGEKPYVCSTCGKRFAQSSVCKRHLRTHTGEKPFTCEVCGSAFGRNDYLKTHMITHTGLNPNS